MHIDLIYFFYFLFITKTDGLNILLIVQNITLIHIIIFNIGSSLW